MSFSVYFISGCNAGTTFEYRVLQKQEQLAAHGVHSLTRQDLADETSLLREAATYDVLYLYRVPYSPFIENLVEQARGRGNPVIFDTDDLVFEPDLVHYVDPLKAMNNEEALLYYEGVWRYRRTLLASDAVVTSTEYLADRARALGKPAFVHYNGLSEWMLAEAPTLSKRPIRPQHDKVILGYGSGTATHRKDFAEIARALVPVLARHPNVELHIIGALHIDNDDPFPLPDDLKTFSERIRYCPAVAWRDWLAVQSSFDINLAPLEAGNPFCDAKSAIKYTEAAVVGVPTIASRTGAFELAIRDGETGFVAGNDAEWIAKLEALVTDPTLRYRMGEAARTDVLVRYTPDRLGTQLLQTLSCIRISREQRPAAVSGPDKTPLILNWIFPEPIPGSGGYTDIIRMINLLASFGHHINAYIVPIQHLWNKSDLEVREFVRHHFTDINGLVIKWTGGPQLASDALILTHWSTAYLADEVDNTAKVFYFVQDWEPFFFPMGVEYLQAEQTYKMGFSCITLGSWLTQRLRAWYNADADYFDFAVDHNVYYPRPIEKTDHPRICFYARPSTPRRLLPIGIAALQLVHQRRPDVEIIFYGVENAELDQYAAIPFPYTNRGILNERQLAELFSASDVGIVLSPTNCSLTSPEMMACKCAVVDLNRETVMGVMEHEVNALLAEPTPAAIADAVLRLLEDAPLRQRLVDTAYQQMQERSWEKSARRVEEILYQKLPAMRSTYRHEAPDNLPALDALPADQQRRLNALHAARRQPFTRAKHGLAAWGNRLLGAEQVMLLNKTPIHTLGELVSKKRIGQSFIARQDGLCHVGVLVATYHRCNTRDIIFHLKESPDVVHDLATVHLSASMVHNQGYASFNFSPQPDSKDKAYYIYLESPESVPGDAITLWAYRNANVPNTTLDINGHVGAGYLVFELGYQDRQWGFTDECPRVYGQNGQITPRGQVRKAMWLLMYRGPKELLREVVNYWKWKLNKG